MDPETSLYNQEMESGREWVLFGGQLLTFPETPVNFDTVTGSSVLHLEQSASDDSWSNTGQLTEEEDNVTLQDTVWSHNVDVGESLELFSNTLDASSGFLEKDVTWFNKTEISDESEAYQNCVDEANDDCLLSYDCVESNDKWSMQDCDKLSTDALSGISHADIRVVPAEKVKSDPDMLVDGLGNLPVKMEYSDAMEEEFVLGNGIYVNSSADVACNNKWHRQIKNTKSSCKPYLSNLCLISDEQQAASAVVTSGHEEEDVDVDLLDSDDASVFKLLEDLDHQEWISESTGKPEIFIKSETRENKTRHKFTIQEKVMQSSIVSDEIIILKSDSEEKSLLSVAGLREIEAVQSYPSTSQNIHVANTLSIIPKAKQVSVASATTASSKFNHSFNTGSVCKLTIVTNKRGPVNNFEIMNQGSLDNYSTCVASKESMKISLNSTHTGTTLDTAALRSDNNVALTSVLSSRDDIRDIPIIQTSTQGPPYSSTSSNDSSCSSSFKVSGSLKYDGFKFIPKAEPVFRAVVQTRQPYDIADKLSERKLRKKEQNVRAALRYRQKKREEKGHVLTEVEKLEQDNERLRSRAEELSQELNYLKNLLEEIQNR